MKTARILIPVLWLAGALAPADVRAGFDTPGSAAFQFLAEEQQVYQGFEDIPPEVLAQSVEGWGEAYFSSEASAFGSGGVFAWAGVELNGPDGPRTATLLFDIDLRRLPLDPDTPLPVEAVRAEYFERRGDTILFEGLVSDGAVWLVDLLPSEDDAGAIEAQFELLFSDPQGRYPGCRVLSLGVLVTDPSPAALRVRLGLPAEPDGSDVYVETGCSGEIYLADDGSGCGGDDTEGDSCGGDTEGDSGGCEGDTSGGSGCESDAGGGCEGDTGGGDCSGGGGGGCSGGGCEGAARASVLGVRHHPGPLRALQRLLPELWAAWFIVWLRRRQRRE